MQSHPPSTPYKSLASATVVAAPEGTPVREAEANRVARRGAPTAPAAGSDAARHDARCGLPRHALAPLILDCARGAT
jgi:hypothetical protein